MGVIKSKPISPGSRFKVSVDRSGLHKGKPFAALTEGKPKTGGRNNKGRITTRHIGAGHKRKYRHIDFLRNKDGIECQVKRIEYDPNRSANIALVSYTDGEYRYIIAPDQLAVGARLISGAGSPMKVGNAMPLSDISVGTIVHCIEMKPGKGAQIARSAGASAQYIAREGEYASLRLRSGEVRKILLKCRATIGSVCNSEHNLVKLGKAGAKRWRGIRPTVRGVAMNPVDHPHGGGEGKTSGGRHPVSPWGVPAKGFKTRKKNLQTDRFIVRRRSRGKS